MTSQDVINDLQLLANKEKAEDCKRFFKTLKGQYSEGDIFLGINVPTVKEIAKKYKDLELNHIETLLNSPMHEIRQCALAILVIQFERLAKKAEENEEKLRLLLSFYLSHSTKANNWDLVDMSAPKILGRWLVLNLDSKTEKLKIMNSLAESKNLWQERISVVACQTPIKEKDFFWILTFGTKQINHSHDLMHKALGWMLREMGKVDKDVLLSYLEEHYKDLSRTSLRYSIEHFEKSERDYWLKRK